MIVDAGGNISKLRRRYTDRLLTMLAVLLTLYMFAFAPLHASGLFVFHGFTIGGFLGIIAAMIVISDSRAALVAMLVCAVANVAVILLRLFHPSWPYNLYMLAAAWLVFALALGAVVAYAVFRPGRVTYHRIIGAILLYLLIALAFATLYVFVGLGLPNSFRGIVFEDNSTVANSVIYFSFVTLTSTGYGDIVPLHPIARSLCSIESVVGILYPATLLGRLVTLAQAQHRNR
jgi:hypothetical protein